MVPSGLAVRGNLPKNSETHLFSSEGGKALGIKKKCDISEPRPAERPASCVPPTTANQEVVTSRGSGVSFLKECLWIRSARQHDKSIRLPILPPLPQSSRGDASRHREIAPSGIRRGYQRCGHERGHVTAAKIAFPGQGAHAHVPPREDRLPTLRRK